MSSNTNNMLEGDVMQQLKAFLNKRKARRGSYGQEGIRPQRDWQLMLYPTAIAVVAVSTLGFYVYNLVETGQFAAAQSSPGQKEVKINSELLKKQIQNLSDRAARWDALNQNVEPAKDPSLP